jgi:hypothetical protein
LTKQNQTYCQFLCEESRFVRSPFCIEVRLSASCFSLGCVHSLSRGSGRDLLPLTHQMRSFTEDLRWKKGTPLPPLPEMVRSPPSCCASGNAG